MVAKGKKRKAWVISTQYSKYSVFPERKYSSKSYADKVAKNMRDWGSKNVKVKETTTTKPIRKKPKPKGLFDDLF